MRQKKVNPVREQMRAYLGNPIYLRLRGYGGDIDEHYGILEYDGKHYRLRTDSTSLAFSVRDVVKVTPFNRTRNYFMDLLKTW